MDRPPPKQVRRLSPDDFDLYSDLRLQGLIECPAAFTTDAEAWRRAPRSTLEAHLDPARSDAPVLGAWLDDDELVGLLGLNREQRDSVRHKAGLWGFYVAPPYRRRGVGTRLVTEMVGLAGAAGLRQLRAVVPTSCVGALSLLEHLGFERYGLERDARLVDGVFHDQAYLAYPLHKTTG
jgi:ribosomal protein S18 acetylase RimI-like enzyme